MSGDDRTSAATAATRSPVVERLTLTEVGYLKGVLDSTGRIANIAEPGYITDYWRKVVQALLDELTRLLQDAAPAAATKEVGSA